MSKNCKTEAPSNGLIVIAGQAARFLHRVSGSLSLSRIHPCVAKRQKTGSTDSDSAAGSSPLMGDLVNYNVVPSLELRLQSGLNLLVSIGFGVTPRSGIHAHELSCHRRTAEHFLTLVGRFVNKCFVERLVIEAERMQM